jgi:hypothetical protein
MCASSPNHTGADKLHADYRASSSAINPTARFPAPFAFAEIATIVRKRIGKCKHMAQACRGGRRTETVGLPTGSALLVTLIAS